MHFGTVLHIRGIVEIQVVEWGKMNVFKITMDLMKRDKSKQREKSTFSS